MKQAGVTLVELLVAIALSSLTLVTALQLVGTGLGSSADMGALASVHDKAAHTMLLIGNSVARAGYLGCGGRATRIADLLRRGLGQTPELDLYEPYAIHRLTDEGSASLDLSRLPVSSGVPHANAIDNRFGLNPSRLLASNDLLVVRGLGFSALPLLSNTGAGEDIKVTSRRGLGRGDFVALTDCAHLEVFRLTGHLERGAHTLLRRASGIGQHDNQASKLRLGRSFPVSAHSQPRLHPIETEIFFIASAVGSGHATALWRKETHHRPLEIISGIDDLSFEEIVDSDGHVLGLRLRFTASSAKPVDGEPRRRTFVRHFAFENLP